jgi:hypothetical protein
MIALPCYHSGGMWNGQPILLVSSHTRTSSHFPRLGGNSSMVPPLPAKAGVAGKSYWPRLGAPPNAHDISWGLTASDAT